mmetsp:Transcript_12020/g.21312  ORF Transcript_12020/g.21312 Transcript_12020/m.21312 type:complete len:87 (-) Transcript_12020:28-288(-)
MLMRALVRLSDVQGAAESGLSMVQGLDLHCALQAPEIELCAADVHRCWQLPRLRRGAARGPDAGCTGPDGPVCPAASAVEGTFLLG